MRVQGYFAGMAAVHALALLVLMGEAHATSSADVEPAETSREQPAASLRHIQVNIPARTLRTYDASNQLVKEYRVAIGTPDHRTTVGTRAATTIVWNPWWYPPATDWAKEFPVTPPGKDNPLGPVKIKLNDAIMIHGTNAPGSVGRAASHGCLRMRNADVIALAKWLQSEQADHDQSAFFNKVKANPKRSFPVALTQSVEVAVVYELMEVRDGRLKVYGDVYRSGTDMVALAKQKLLHAGYAANPEFLGRLQKKRLRDAGNIVLDMPLEAAGKRPLADSSPQESRTAFH